MVNIVAQQLANFQDNPISVMPPVYHQNPIYSYNNYIFYSSITGQPLATGIPPNSSGTTGTVTIVETPSGPIPPSYLWIPPVLDLTDDPLSPSF